MILVLGITYEVKQDKGSSLPILPYLYFHLDEGGSKYKDKEYSSLPMLFNIQKSDLIFLNFYGYKTLGGRGRVSLFRVAIESTRSRDALKSH